MASSSTQVNIRIPESHRTLIDRAAESLGVSRTQFMLDAARERAEARLAEQPVIELDQESFAALQAVLDGPVVVPDGLRDVMTRRPAWDALK